MDSTGITIIASVGSAIVAIVGTLVYIGFRPRAFEAGPYAQTVTERLPILNWFIVLYYFLPYGLFLFGVIYDGLVRRIKFFPAGFIGLANVYLNALISRGINGSFVENSDVCGIPGMSSTGSLIAPQNVLFSTTVMSYIASYITSTQSDANYSGAAWGGVGITFLINTAMYYSNKCYQPDANKPPIWKGAVAGSFTPLFYALAGGMLVGGGSGALIAKFGGDPGVGLESEQKQSLTSGKGPAMAPTSGTAGAGKCSSTDSDDAFVCEAYKNGELVTSTIVE